MMTLHELAESLRKVAYDLDEANRRWDSNDRHVAGLNETIARLTTRVRLGDAELADLRGKLARKRPLRKTAKKRKVTR